MKRFAWILGLWVPYAAQAYGPIFAPRLQLPGAETFTGALGVREVSHGTDIELGLAYGLSRSWAIGARLPFLINEADSAVELRQASAETLYRFYNRDALAAKHAGVANLTCDVVDRSGSGWDLYPVLSVGYLADYRRWISIVGARWDRKAGALSGDVRRFGKGTENARALWADGTYGWRFFQANRKAQDAMLALSSQFRMDRDPAVFLAPEILFQPEVRWLMKLGYRFPLVSNRGNRREESQWAYELEIRF